jgi:tRNA nucleotidyltransferase/poly(A) polymerase
VELDKERDFKMEYKHNIKIWKKNNTENEQKIKMLIQKLKDENEELKAKIALMKTQAKELKELKKTVEAWETIKRKWAKTLFHYKQQQEALGSHVEALTKEKKEKENALIDLELMNLKSASLLNFEKLKRRIAEAEKEVGAGK